MARSLDWYQRVSGSEVLNRTKIDSGLADDITGLSNASVDMVRGYVGSLLIELVETHCDGDLSANRAPGAVRGMTISAENVRRCYDCPTITVSISRALHRYSAIIVRCLFTIQMV